MKYYLNGKYRMTDKEIINALESEIHLAEYVDSDYCSNVKLEIIKSSLNLITRQQSEIERLQKEVNLVSIQFQDIQEHYEEAQAEIERLEKVLNGRDQLVNALNKCYNQAKSEAVKEFARRLKCGVPQETGVIRCSDIDNLVKEMEGENNA